MGLETKQNFERTELKKLSNIMKLNVDTPEQLATLLNTFNSIHGFSALPYLSDALAEYLADKE